MGKSDPVSAFLEQFRIWGSKADDISAVILVGSYARGEARLDSDIDLVIIAESPERYLLEQSWLENFGQPLKTQHEDWGLVQSLRVWYGSGLEIEFGFTSNAWIAEPLDGGTRKVLEDGFHFIINKEDFSP
jgi:predicted nucleotidyltransferase